MKVFSTCCKVMRRHWAALSIYLVIFLTLSVVMTSFSSQQQTSSFSQTKTKVAVLNRDGEASLAQSLADYVADNTELVELPDEKEALQDALFFQAVDYILTIPQGYSSAFMSDAALSLEVHKIPNSAAGFYTDMLIDRYLNAARIYKTALPNMSTEELSTAIKADLAAQSNVEKKSYSANTPIDLNFAVYYTMQAYILMVLTILGISTLMMVFNRPDLRMRNLCTPVRTRSMTAQIALAGGVFGLICWLALVILGFLIYGSRLAGTDVRGIVLCVLNSLVFTVVSLSVSFLCGIFIRSSNMQNAVANFLSLAMSFLGGAFVPLEMLGGSLLSVAHFIPTYWYISTLDTIITLTKFNAETLAPVYQGMLIQLGFAVAIFSVALMISKTRQQSGQGFGRNMTEIAS